MAPTTTPPAGASKWLVYASAAANGLVVAVTVAFVASIIPGLGLAQRKVMLSRAVFQVAAAAHALRIVSAVGLPQLRPLDTEKLKRYVATVSGTSDAHYLIVCILFVVQRPFPPVMFSPFLFALMRVASFLQKQVPATQRLMAPVLENREAEFMAMAAADIAALPLLVITSFLQRSFLLPISYAMLLRTRYHSPSGSKYHQAVWQKVDARLQPYVDRAPPIAGRPLVQQVVEKVKLLWTKQNEPVAR